MNVNLQQAGPVQRTVHQHEQTLVKIRNKIITFKLNQKYTSCIKDWNIAYRIIK